MFLNQKFLHKFLTQSLTQKDESPGKPSDLDMFELFYQPEVVAQLRRWFKLEAPSGYLGEYQVLGFMRDLTDFADHKILDVFDGWDKHARGQLAFPDFFILLSMLIARSTSNLTRFLYLHGSHLADVVCSAANASSAGSPADRETANTLILTLLFLGFTLDLEPLVHRAIALFDLEHIDYIDHNMFELVMFWICTEHDKLSSQATRLHAPMVVAARPTSLANARNARDRLKSKACTVL